MPTITNRNRKVVKRARKTLRSKRFRKCRNRRLPFTTPAVSRGPQGKRQYYQVIGHRQFRTSARNRGWPRGKQQPSVRNGQLQKQEGGACGRAAQ